MRNVHTQQTSSLEKGLHLKSNRFEQNIKKSLDAGRQSGGGRIVATFYDLCSEIRSGSPATESIHAGLETVECLKTPVDEDIDLLKRASKENNNVELEEEDDFDE